MDKPAAGTRELAKSFFDPDIEGRAQRFERRGVFGHEEFQELQDTVGTLGLGYLHWALEASGGDPSLDMILREHLLPALDKGVTCEDIAYFSQFAYSEAVTFGEKLNGHRSLYEILINLSWRAEKKR